MVSAAAKVSQLQCVTRIPMRNLSRTDTEHLFVFDMCALSAEEVLLACSAAGLRAVSLHNTQLVAHEPSAIRYVYGVAFEALTDTLLLLVGAPTDDYYQLVSLRRNESEWLEVQRLDTRIRAESYYIFKFAVCDSRVLLGGRYTLNVFDVSAEHTLLDAGNVTWQSRFRKFECTGLDCDTIVAVVCTRRDSNTLVAFSDDTSVFLQRLASLPLRLEPLASVNLTAPRLLLFRGDLLIIADWNRANRTDTIVSFRVSGNALTERRVLLDAQAGVYVGAWALASDRLVLMNWELLELLVYAFK